MDRVLASKHVESIPYCKQRIALADLLRATDSRAMDIQTEIDTARALAEQQRIALAGYDLSPADGFVETSCSPATATATAGSRIPKGQDVEPVGDPCWWGVREIATAYRMGNITPLELVDALIARIDRLDPGLHAFTHLDLEGARAVAADPALPKGLLYGIPIGIKDVIDVKGMATTCHSRLRLNHIANEDAPVVAQLRAAGAIIMGKLATHEFAIGGPSFDLPFPPARNPWNTDHHPGGSSSGAGVAVAAGLVPLAIGTDTAGSVRNPASACGIVGLKPTRSALFCNGVFPLAWTLDHVGILGRSVDDVDLAYAALADPGPVRTDLRIGFVRHFHEIDMPADPEVTAALDHVAEALGAIEVSLPPLDDFALCNRVILQSEGFAIHAKDLRTRPELFARRTRNALLPGMFVSAEDYVSARRLQTRLTAAVDAAFAEIDILITASSMTPACRIDDEGEIDRTYLRQARTVFNVTGHPALAMMAGVSEDGLPLSVQFAARRGEEATLFRAAALWERAMGGPQRPPIA